MQNLQDKTLVVFHSYKMSFAAWQEAGILSRELTLYRALKPSFKKIIFASYATDLNAERALAGGDFEVVAHNDYAAFSQADIFRINQMSGFLAAGPAKIRFWNKKLVVRCGFMWSRFQRHLPKSHFGRFMKSHFVRFIEWLGFMLASRIILTSDSDKKYIDKRYWVSPEKVTIIRNLIDTELFKSSVISHQSMHICAVGRLETQKNYESLILALKSSDYQLDIFGQGEMRAKLEKLAKDNGVNVNFRGIVPNDQLAKELPKYGAFVLASHYEGNPKSLLEAMSCGLPVIASDIEAHRDIIASGANGILCQNTPEAIRAAIDKLADDQNLAEKLGQSARAWILENCSLSVVLEKELNIYKNL